MKLGQVVGTVVSPVSHPFFEGRKLLLCDLVDPDGGPITAVPRFNSTPPASRVTVSVSTRKSAYEVAPVAAPSKLGCS